jgi:hypothetical protein
MITISRLTISGCIGLAIIVFTSLGSNVLAQKLRNWEMRGKVESHVPIYNPAYGENSYIGLGAEAERYLGNCWRINSTFAALRSFSNEKEGFYIRKISYGINILFMHRSKFPLGFKLGVGIDNYWIRFPEIDFGMGPFNQSNEKWFFIPVNAGIIARISSKIEICCSVFIPTRDELALFVQSETYLSASLRYRWAKGKPDPVGEEK